MENITKEQLVELIEKTLATAPCVFECVAKGPLVDVGLYADRMPESWMVTLLMQALFNKGLAAFPEVRMNNDDDIGCFRSCEKPLFKDDFKKLHGKKIDLFVGDSGSSSKEHLRLRAVLELKGPKSDWGAFESDLERLRFIANVLNYKDIAIIFAYVSPPLTSEGFGREERRFMDETGLEKDKFHIIPAECKSVATDKNSYVFICQIA